MGERVVVVDDDVVVHMTLELALADVEVVEAFAVDEGFETGVGLKPDAFVIGRRVRGVDGLTAVRRLRQDLRTNRTPIVVLSPEPTRADELLALEAGADAYLPKPVDPALVLAHVHAVMAIDLPMRRQRRHRSIESLRSGLEPEPLVVDLREPAEDGQKGRHRGWWHRHPVAASTATG